MRDEKSKLKELSNNISDRSEAKGTGIMSDLLLVNGEARQLVANPHYTILFMLIRLPTGKMKRRRVVSVGTSWKSVSACLVCSIFSLSAIVFHDCT